MTDIALVTAVYGAFDVVQRAPKGFDDCVLVTDRRHARVGSRYRGWRVVHLPRAGTPARLASKLPRCRPDFFTDCSTSVWIDGSFSVVDGGGLATVARELLTEHDLVLAIHPESDDGWWGAGRKCLYDEAVFSAKMPNYASEPVIEQAEQYLAAGMPRGWGLWANGLPARRHNARTAELGMAWLSEIERWSVQDQISLPFRGSATGTRACGPFLS